MSTCPPKFSRSLHPDARPRAAGPLLAARPVEIPAYHPAADEARLRDGQLWVAPRNDAEGLRVRCTGGYVWVTEEGRPEDVVLGDGQTYVSAGSGKLVVQALEDASMCVASSGYV